MQITLALAAEIFFFAFTLWLGMYLLALNRHKATLLLTGLGLVAYAIALAVEILFGQQIIIVLLLPALLWIGAALYLLPEDMEIREALLRAWVLASIPIAILTSLNAWFALIVIFALFGCALMIVRLAARSYFKNTFAVIAAITLFIPLSTGLLILPLNWIPPVWAISLLGLDLVLLGFTITIWDAFDEGETLRAHMLSSIISAFYYAGSLGILVALFNSSQLLLLSVITFGIVTQTFSVSIQSLLDRLILTHELNIQRQALRHTADSLPRHSPLELIGIDEQQFTHLTRRALSNLGDLPKLATSPLTNLPAITASNPLDRAYALKILLCQSIQKLKPSSPQKFGTTDEWRYYNALYFPYVLGLKPYNRRSDYSSLDESARQALNWFQANVPERTLHNWQNIAARLVAEDLKHLPN
jgi:hypothetical protein